nr:hypothetical protein [Tanacetum cinerariifolium]
MRVPNVSIVETSGIRLRQARLSLGLLKAMVESPTFQWIVDYHLIQVTVTQLRDALSMDPPKQRGAEVRHGPPKATKGVSQGLGGLPSLVDQNAVARNWFDEELSRKFLEEFSQQKSQWCLGSCGGDGWKLWGVCRVMERGRKVEEMG